MKLIALEGFADVALEAGVEVGAAFAEGFGAGIAVVYLTAEGHQGAEGIALVADVGIDRQLPAHGFFAGAHYHHGFGLAIE